MTSVLQHDQSVPMSSPVELRPVPGILAQSWMLTGQSLRVLARTPAYLAFTLIQPILWLLLFGQLFSSIVHLPGFHASSGNYLSFLTPGVIIMTALFSSGWAGTTFIESMNLGVMDRFLASPTRRSAMVISSLAHQAVTTFAQTLIVFGIAYATGARFRHPAAGIPITVISAVLVAVIIAAFSDAIALLVRQQEALIGISQFIVLPLQFLSSSIMDLSLAPHWIRIVARYNFVDWAATAARDALDVGTSWSAVGSRLGLLAAAALVMGALATRAFRVYQRAL